MKLLEYQGKELFAENGIPVPRGMVVTSALEAEEAAAQLGENIVLKAQVPVGGRGKAGGIKFVDNLQYIRSEAEKLFHLDIEEFSVEKLLIEEKIDITKEIYMGLVVDIDTGDMFFFFT